MIPLILTADEARRAAAGTLTEIRRPVVNAPRHWSEWDGLDGVTYQTGYTRIEPSPTGLFIWSMDWRDPQPPRLSPFGAPGDLLFGQEVWGVGCRPCPFHGWRDGIEYEADEAWLTDDRDLLPLYCVETPEDVCLGDYEGGGWKSASLMPEWASRFAFVNRGVRAERVDDGWMWIVSVERLSRPNGEPMPPSEVQR